MSFKMRNYNFDELLEILKNSGWNIRVKNSDSLFLGKPFIERYGNIPEDYLTFL